MAIYDLSASAFDGDQNRIPEGLPRWITRELIEQTIRVWQRYYRQPLTIHDAADMLMATSRLFRVLSRSPST